MKFIVRVIKRVIFSFLVLYGLNIILNPVNFNIPINYATLGSISILGVPGVIVLILWKFVIK